MVNCSSHLIIIDRCQSVSWHPTDPAVFSMSSLDNSITIWDMSVEPDDADLLNGQPITSECPDQLMFQHMGQSHISEIQWHPQIPGNTTCSKSESLCILHQRQSKTHNMNEIANQSIGARRSSHIRSFL